jgi:hypothetical protein
MKLFLVFFLIFFLSRLPFLKPQAIFFDSPEYLSRLNEGQFLKALASGHPPFHAGYLLINWPFFQLAKLSHFNPLLFVQIITVILGFFTIFFFYRLVENLFSPKLAFGASLLFSLNPYFWLTNVSLMIETPYVFFFTLSLYLFSQFLKSGRKNWLFLSGLAFGFAYFIHPLVMIWLSAFFSVWLLKKKKKKYLKAQLFSCFVFLSLFYFLNVFLFYQSQLFNLKAAFSFGLFGKTNEHLSLYPLSTLLPRLLRNWLLLLTKSNTNLLLILFFLSLFYCWRKNQKKIFWAALAWFLPSLIANQWWDSVLMGRHSLLASPPLSLFSLFPFFRSGSGIILTLREKIFILGLTLNFLAVSGAALILLTQPIPYLELAKATANLPPNSLLLESHFAQPYTSFAGQTIFINEPGWPKANLVNLIEEKLAAGKAVFATSQALNDPYGLYSGPYLHPLSLNCQGQAELSFIFERYDFLKSLSVNENKHLFIYQIKQKTNKNYSYQEFLIPVFSRERIDYFDFLSQFWFLTLKALKPFLNSFKISSCVS